MIRAVIQNDFEIHHRKSGKIPSRGRVLDALLHRGYEVLGNGATENVVHKLEFSAARQRLHLDLAIAVLTVSASLFLVASLHVGLAADGLPVRHLRRFSNY